MNDDETRSRARAAGLASNWTDAFGKTKHVTVDTLRLVLDALGLAGSAAPEDGGLGGADGLPPLLTADAGGHTPVPDGAVGQAYVVHLDSFERVEGVLSDGAGGAGFEAPATTGYHRLETGGEECILAIAPAACFTIADALRRAGRTDTRCWGLSAQLYALRRPGDGGLGDVEALARFARAAASRGADALSISPVHAQFSADPDRFSPYAPSSRVLRNVLHAAVELEGEEAAELEGAALVDWPRAGRLRLAALRREFERAGRDDPAFLAWRRTADDSVELHARFETLHRHHFAGGHGPWHWRDWPDAHRVHASAAVASFAREHADEVALHAWMQYRIEHGLDAAQEQARRAGMAVGLVSDLAVGADSGGSHCWSRPAETLLGLTVGAPPDLLAPEGQDWGITAFSPHGLRAHGFRAFIEMVRAALRNAGGVRIDHAMGLNRLWVVPNGHSSADGTYLAMPEADLMRLLRIESQRHQGIVLAEDLGTVPEGFSDRLRAAGIDGMRVLWFEHETSGRFRAPRDWPRQASAMTSTHDLATVSGWWRGRDIDWNEKLGRDVEGARAERASAREAIWGAMCENEAAEGTLPAEWDGHRVADAAVSFLGRTACELAMLPIEDALALEEAPNLPGTTTEHPNWRRRLPGDAETLLDSEHVTRRLALLDATRRTGA